MCAMCMVHVCIPMYKCICMHYTCVYIDNVFSYSALIFPLLNCCIPPLILEMISNSAVIVGTKASILSGTIVITILNLL